MVATKVRVKIQSIKGHLNWLRSKSNLLNVASTKSSSRLVPTLLFCLSTTGYAGREDLLIKTLFWGVWSLEVSDG